MLPAGLGGTQSVVAGPTDSGTLGQVLSLRISVPEGLTDDVVAAAVERDAERDRPQRDARCLAHPAG